MNKISDLKVGDKVAIINDGEFIVLDIGYYNGNILKEQVVFTEHRHVNENGIDWQKTNELNNKQMKELKIEVPKGFEIDKEKSSIEWLIDKWGDYPLEIGKATFRRYLLIAKEKHKKEIIEACENFGNLNVVDIKDYEQYYTEKYGQ